MSLRVIWKKSPSAFPNFLTGTKCLPPYAKALLSMLLVLAFFHDFLSIFGKGIPRRPVKAALVVFALHQNPGFFQPANAALYHAPAEIGHMHGKRLLAASHPCVTFIAVSPVELIFLYFPPDMLQQQGGGYAEPFCNPGIEFLRHPKTSFPPVCKGRLIAAPKLPQIDCALRFLPADFQEYRRTHDKRHKRNADSCLYFHTLSPPVPFFSCSLPPERRTRRSLPRIKRIRLSTIPRCSHRPSLAW